MGQEAVLLGQQVVQNALIHLEQLQDTVKICTEAVSKSEGDKSMETLPRNLAPSAMQADLGFAGDRSCSLAGEAFRSPAADLLPIAYSAKSHFFGATGNSGAPFAHSGALRRRALVASPFRSYQCGGRVTSECLDQCAT